MGGAPFDRGSKVADGGMPEIDRLDSTDGTDGTDVTMVLERGARLLTIQRLPYDGRKRRS